MLLRYRTIQIAYQTTLVCIKKMKQKCLMAINISLMEKRYRRKKPRGNRKCKYELTFLPIADTNTINVSCSIFSNKKNDHRFSKCLSMFILKETCKYKLYNNMCNVTFFNFTISESEIECLRHKYHKLKCIKISILKILYT